MRFCQQAKHLLRLEVTCVMPIQGFHFMMLDCPFKVLTVHVKTTHHDIRHRFLQLAASSSG
jgi:hypothetical protein